ncbi:MAG: ABC transporter permease [Imperialibacter sp.]|uniref:ABC transporter permease n=1 Tax=Imperialibacter sp. TaxID=2038411 RepID=UPI0032EE5D1E
MKHPIVLLILTNFREFLRQPGAVFWAVFFPVLMAGGLGLAFTQKGELNQKIAFVGNEQTEEKSWSKKVGNETTGFTNYEFLNVGFDEGLVLLKRGTVDLIVKKEGEKYKYHFDPLNPEAQLAYINLTAALNGNQTLSNGEDVVPLKEIGSRYIDFLVPGLMAMGVMMSCMWGISYGLIEKRSKMLLRRMVATPMRKAHFMTALLISRTVMSAIEASILVVFSWLFFDIRIEGSFLALVVLFLSGTLAFAGIAVLTASRTDNTYVGNGILNAVVMPMTILSGVFFSYHGFPDWAVSIIRLFPLTIFADTARAIFIEGAGWSQIVLPVGVLAGLGLVCMSIGMKVFKWY